MFSICRAVARSAPSLQRAVIARSSPASITSITALRVGSSVSRLPSFWVVERTISSSAVRLRSDENAENVEEVVVDASKTRENTGEAVKPNEDETPYGIWIRNLTFDTTDAHLAEHFERFGGVHRTSVGRDGRGLSKGWGFVWFKEQEGMDKALRETDGSFWNGRRLQVAPRVKRAAADRPSSNPSSSLYIGNIPYETTDAALNDIFRDLRGVKDVRVAIDRTTGWPRGFAHADFEDVETAQAALDQLNNVTIGDRKLRVDFAGRSRTTAPR